MARRAKRNQAIGKSWKEERENTELPLAHWDYIDNPADPKSSARTQFKHISRDPPAENQPAQPFAFPRNRRSGPTLLRPASSSTPDITKRLIKAKQGSISYYQFICYTTHFFTSQVQGTSQSDISLGVGDEEVWTKFPARPSG